MGFVRYDATEGIALITIDRPDKRNAMTYAVLEEFIAASHAALTECFGSADHREVRAKLEVANPNYFAEEDSRAAR